jgi:hypothetical protein
LKLQQNIDGGILKPAVKKLSKMTTSSWSSYGTFSVDKIAIVNHLLYAANRYRQRSEKISARAFITDINGLIPDPALS